MSGIVNGISKVFSTVTSGVARVAKAVTGVGATAFTAGAASGAGSMASGGLNGVISSFTGGGVLSNILTGAIKQAGYGALIGGAIGAVTGQGFAKGAMYGAIGGAVTGGLGAAFAPGTQPPAVQSVQAAGSLPAATPTGLSPTGTAAAPVAAAEPASGLGRFLTSEAGGSMIAGLGQGIMAWQGAKEERETREREQKRLTDSYNVDPSALAPSTQVVASDRPSPSEQYGRPQRWRYDSEARRMVYA